MPLVAEEFEKYCWCGALFPEPKGSGWGGGALNPATSHEQHLISGWGLYPGSVLTRKRLGLSRLPSGSSPVTWGKNPLSNGTLVENLMGCSIWKYIVLKINGSGLHVFDTVTTPLSFPCGSACKEYASNVGDLGLIHGLGRSPGEGKGYPLQYSGLENSMNCIGHGVTKNQTCLSNIHFHST